MSIEMTQMARLLWFRVDTPRNITDPEKEVYEFLGTFGAILTLAHQLIEQGYRVEAYDLAGFSLDLSNYYAMLSSARHY